jgi:chromosome segregation ATPase
MEAICYDFESRCHNVEEPMRTIEEQRDNLYNQLEEARQLNVDLEFRAKQSSELIANLRVEVSRLADRERNSSMEAKSLAAQLGALLTELDTVSKESEDSAKVDRRKARTRELDLMAIVTDRDDQVEELQTEMENLKREYMTLKERSQVMAAENEVVAQEREALRFENTRLQQVLDDRNALVLEKEDHIQALDDTNKDLICESQSLWTKV